MPKAASDNRWPKCLRMIENSFGEEEKKSPLAICSKTDVLEDEK